MELSKLILKIINISKEPLETREIEKKVRAVKKTATRVKVLYRLMNLRGDGLISGKHIGSGKGTWIWWSKKLFGGKNG